VVQANTPSGLEDLRWATSSTAQAICSNRGGGGGPAATDLFTVSSRFFEHLLETFSMSDGDGRLVASAVIRGGDRPSGVLPPDGRRAGAATRHQAGGLSGRADVGLPTSAAGDSRFLCQYFLHHAPVCERASATGHAVRELYLQAESSTLRVETHDHELLRASEDHLEDCSVARLRHGAHGSRMRRVDRDAYELPAIAPMGRHVLLSELSMELEAPTGDRRARYAKRWSACSGTRSRGGSGTGQGSSTPPHCNLRMVTYDADEDSRTIASAGTVFLLPTDLARSWDIQAYLFARCPGLQCTCPSADSFY